jgi:hypothetical protein
MARARPLDLAIHQAVEVLHVRGAGAELGGCCLPSLLGLSLIETGRAVRQGLVILFQGLGCLLNDVAQHVLGRIDTAALCRRVDAVHFFWRVDAMQLGGWVDTVKVCSCVDTMQLRRRVDAV